MGLDFFRRSVELAERYRSPGQRVVYTIQTNGTLLDDEWAAFFREHGFLVGISIDGPREIHDTYRVNKGGKGTLRPRDARAGAPARRAASSGTRSRHPRRERATAAARSTASCATSAARVSCSSSRSSSASPEAADAGACRGRSWRDRPLYVQDGDLVTDRSVTPRAVRAVPDRRVRGVGAPRRRRGVRADVRRRARELVRRAARPVRPLRDVRARARARAHRRPLLLRPLRRARATSSATSASST